MYFCSCPNLIVFFVVCGVLALATALSNVTVLIVCCTNKKLMNGQTVYRISLAVSDFFTGTVIFPAFIITPIYQLVTDGNLKVEKAYIDAIGFFAALSFHVSAFTLSAASFDRFKVVYHPLSYNLKLSILTAWKICAVLWIISIMIAALPLGVFGEKLQYKIFLGGIPMPDLSNSSLTYLYISCVFFLPVILMWIFTIMTFVFYKKYLKKRQNIISTIAHKQEMKKQIRLLFTLGIMVIVFSVCILPIVISCFFIFYDTSIEKVSSNFWTSRTMPTIILCSLVMCASNSLWNFFIYSVRDKAFRTSSKNLYKRLLCCLK